MELIRGISGIRGIVGKSLTESVVIKHIQAFSEIQSAGDILLARDSRTHGASFINTAAETLPPLEPMTHQDAGGEDIGDCLYSGRYGSTSH